ncbi:hypothetical protein ACKWTF_006518 [Chironomus riparius]
MCSFDKSNIQKLPILKYFNSQIPQQRKSFLNEKSTSENPYLQKIIHLQLYGFMSNAFPTQNNFILLRKSLSDRQSVSTIHIMSIQISTKSARSTKLPHFKKYAKITYKKGSI